MALMTNQIRWGIIGCGNVTEVKSGPGFQKAQNSALVAVMRRDRDQAADYAQRHGVPKFYDQAAELINDPDVDAVYVATPPSSHSQLGLAVAAARKPCLMEKPMAMDHAECVELVDAFRRSQTPLFVAYYRRALPRFLKVRELLQAGAIGRLTSVHILQFDRLAVGEAAQGWRFDPAIAGSGLFMDLASHGLDLLDFLVSPICQVAGFAINTGGTYKAEDVTAACFEFRSGVVGHAVWNFKAGRWDDRITFTGSAGELETPVFTDGDIILRSGGEETVHEVRNPPHVHQPLIQTIVDELLGRGKCESTGESGARTSWVMDCCLKSYYR
ncbi:MAG: gfo/Idh/MocA family oxidoreductase [Acidobacteria bacterium]|nr:MAG: gfo/Idh/MocA family oxidoreductase [Acidobacteriota bacterium]